MANSTSPTFAPRKRPQLTLAQLSHHFAEAAARTSPARACTDPRPHASYLPDDSPVHSSAKHSRSKSAVTTSTTRATSPLRRRPSLRRLFAMGQTHGKSVATDVESHGTTTCTTATSATTWTIDSLPLPPPAPSAAFLSRGAREAAPSAYHQRATSGGRNIVRKLSSRARLRRDAALNGQADIDAGGVEQEALAPSMPTSPMSPMTPLKHLFRSHMSNPPARPRSPRLPRTPSTPSTPGSPHTPQTCAFSGRIGSRFSVTVSPRHPLAPHMREAQTHHRPSGASARESVKSARRAEREWRAKVAALGASASTADLLAPAHSSPRAKPTALSPAPRGPVPPLRLTRPAEAAPSLAAGTESLLDVPQTGVLGKAHNMVKRSFETLGHHAQHAHDRSPNTMRSPSVPSAQASTALASTALGSSVRRTQLGSEYASSFYANPNGSRVSMRPPSIAATALPSIKKPVEDTDTTQSATSKTTQPHSLRGLATQAVSLPWSEYVSNEPLEPTTPVALAESRRTSLPSTPSTPASLRSSSTKFHSLPADLPSAPVLSGLHRPAALTLGGVAPRQQSVGTPRGNKPETPDSQPATPFSPTTAFILSAPSIDRLAWSGLIGSSPTSPCAKTKPGSPRSPRSLLSSDADESGNLAAHSRAAHPFACPRPDTGSSRSPTAEDAEVLLSPNPLLEFETAADPSAPRGHSSRGHGWRPAPTAATGSSKAHVYHAPTPMAGRSKTQVLGSSQAANRPTMRGSALTPGMDTGRRPPKSGLPMDDLQRWLAQTTMA
ncbi:hypothetical protein Q5752_001075 [Cryptotrichosporon argae]